MLLNRDALRLVVTHRQPKITGRCIELWEYRQRWGAMNLEREDRLFLRKAEKALPAIVTGRAAAKKSIKDKTYYRWLRFHLDAMTEAEAGMGLGDGERGA